MLYYFKENTSGGETLFTTSLYTEKTSTEFVFRFDCSKSKCFSAYEGFNEPLYMGDVTEIFLCTDKSKKTYYEIEAAPNGACFFALINNPAGDGTDLSHEFLPRKIIVSVGKLKGGYLTEIRVPFSSVNYFDGEFVEFNAFRIETEGGIPEKNLLALNPTLCGFFHKTSAFIKLI